MRARAKRKPQNGSGRDLSGMVAGPAQGFTFPGARVNAISSPMA